MTNSRNVSVRGKIKLGNSTILILNLLLFLFLSLFTKTFFSVSNLYSLIYGVSIQFFAIIGFTYLLILGEIDLSVGAMYGLSGTIVGFLMSSFQMNFYVAVCASLIICALFGLAVGTVIVRLHLNSMMVTLATMTLFQGINAVVFNKMSASIYPSVYRQFAKHEIAGIYWTIIAMVLLVIVLELLLKKTTLFKRLYYIGFHPQSARLYGCQVGKTKALCFMVSSFTAALGGIIATSRITHSDINTGSGLEFTMLTACVIGGCSMLGGKGSMFHAALGLVFLAMLTNGMIIFKIDPYMQNIAVGVILVLAVFADVQMNRKK